MTSEVGCPRCNPLLAPEGPRRYAMHVAVRFSSVLELAHTLVVKDHRILDDVLEVDAILGQAWRSTKRPCETGCTDDDGLLEPGIWIDKGSFYFASRRV